MCGKWLSMNILMIDEKRVIVDPHHTSMMRAMEKWGFEPIPVPFLHYAAFGGAFHCATLDVRRRGYLKVTFTNKKTSYDFIDLLHSISTRPYRGE